jgi:hypothetical protein
VTHIYGTFAVVTTIKSCRNFFYYDSKFLILLLFQHNNAGKEREQDLAPDPLQPLSQDQRQAGRRQLDPCAQHQTKSTQLVEGEVTFLSKKNLLSPPFRKC